MSVYFKGIGGKKQIINKILVLLVYFKECKFLKIYIFIIVNKRE